jgi:site-specific DNA recombinase
MIRSAIYARISDDRAGKGLGVKRQIEDCERLISERGWTVASTYVDNDTSAYRGHSRPQYEAMLADLSGGQLDAIVVYHQDRLTRTPSEFEDFLRACTDAGMSKFTTVTGFADLGQSDGIMVARIQAAVAANESDAKSRRIRRKNDERAANGLPHSSGERPFGYELDRVTVVPSEADVIRHLAERFMAGEPLISLTQWLQDEGIKTATGLNDWRTPTLRNLLMAPRIAGLRVHRGEVVGHGIWPPIISEDLHHSLVTKLSDPSRVTNRTPRRYALSGMLRCAECGHKMVSNTSHHRRRYACKKGPDFGGCGGVFIAAESLDVLIADAVLTRLDSPELAAQFNGRDGDDPLRSQLRDAISTDERQLAELQQAYAERLITMKEWLGASRTIRDRFQRNQKQFDRMNRDNSMAGLLGQGQQLRQTWGGLSLGRQAAIIAQLIDHIVIHKAAKPANRIDPNRIEPIWRV